MKFRKKQVSNNCSLTVNITEEVKMLEFNEWYREFWMRYLDDFVPGNIYDMHTHLWSEKGQRSLAPSALRLKVGISDLQRFSEQFYCGRKCHFLLLATPLKDMNPTAFNQWMAGEIAKDDRSIAAMIVTPAMTPEEVAGNFESGAFHGVKPYRVFAADPANARITEYIPEKLLEVVDHYHMAVTLHLSFPDGAANPDNQADLKYLTRRYPNITWILAHCARAFNANFMVDAIHVLKELPHIYYDTSAVNDLYSHYLLLKHEDRKRIMFGSDNIAAGGVPGKYITYADAWLHFPGMDKLEHCDSRAVPVVYEQLLQQKRVADMLEMNTSEIEDIFYRNAENLIAVLKKRLP
ncbi:MAG: hypothetical protein E7058_09415 [Lentisphaerae bacterium]|nr:hypothetical protein [Lentisphaerota bacterium]